MMRKRVRSKGNAFDHFEDTGMLSSIASTSIGCLTGAGEICGPILERSTSLIIPSMTQAAVRWGLTPVRGC